MLIEIGRSVRYERDPRIILGNSTPRLDDRLLELRALTVGQSYWVAIESFDENGVSTLSGTVPIR